MRFEKKRKMNEFERLVIPIDLRTRYGINSRDEVVLIPTETCIVMTKSEGSNLNV